MEAVTRVHPVGCAFSLEVPSRHVAVYEGGGYERFTTALFLASASSSRTVLDIGAHMGYFSLLARQANPESDVIAVEASPDNHEVLARNVAQAAGAHPVTTINAAFGSTTGTVRIQLTEASDNCGISGHPNSPTLGTVEVPAITGEALGVEPGGALTIKLDVEGHELAALAGLAPVLDAAESVRMFVELNPKCLQAVGSAPETLVAWFHSRGMRTFLLDEATSSWVELTAPADWADHIAPGGYANLYCIDGTMALTVGAVLHAAGVSGAERSHTESVEALAARGVLVRTVVPGADVEGLGDRLRAAGSSVVNVDPLAWWYAPGSQPATVTGLVSADVLHALRGVDVVLTQTGVVPQGALAAEALGIPHVWYLREFGDLDHGYQTPAAPEELGAVVAGLSAAVVTNSAAVRDHFFPGRPAAAEVVHPAPRVPSIATARPEARPTTAAVVASLNEGKGQQDVIEAVALLRGAGVDMPLVLVGAGADDEAERLRDRARQLGVADLLQLVGPLQSREDIYSRCDIVVVPSRSEAFGRVPFEAVESGIPVVYAAAGGIAEYMVDGTTGLAYPPGDVKALAHALRMLIEDPALRDELAVQGRAVLGDPGRQIEFADALLRVLRGAAASGPVERVGVGRMLHWLIVDAMASARTVQEAGHRAAIDERDAAVAELGRLRDDRAAIERALIDLQNEHARASVAYTELWADRDRVFAELDQSRAAEASEAARRAEDAAAHAAETTLLRQQHAVALAAADDRYDQIVGSRTWRSTQVLRAVSARVRRPSGGA